MRRRTIALEIILIALVFRSSADEPRPAPNLPRGVVEPVLRVANKPEPAPAPRTGMPGLVPTAPKPGEHPLEPAVRWARDGLAHSRTNVRDYTCRLVKREAVGGEIGDHQFLFAKIRNRKTDGQHVTTPFSVYLHFLSPENVKGQEVIYVEGKNDGKLIAHKGGLGARLVPTMNLDPKGSLAMRGNRYPITEIGIENLLVKLIERAERDRQNSDCQIEFHRGAKVDGRVCTVLQVTYPAPRPQLDFHVARVFVDDELRLPIRYAAYNWPLVAGGEPQLIEEYTYCDLKVNVGLTDADFDAKNKAYRF